MSKLVRTLPSDLVRAALELIHLCLPEKIDLNSPKRKHSEKGKSYRMQAFDAHTFIRAFVLFREAMASRRRLQHAQRDGKRSRRVARLRHAKDRKSAYTQNYTRSSTWHEHQCLCVLMISRLVP
ncbi:hypothetical protein Y032_0678g1448 [Ancylostoma ceylanicum]|uniref:Uncharacterized protein n=1 Tax=Ancylostoma ceylanicum TaxID=53326 RepID=A0A016WHH6_9BILA|nr:hypothetical protein Y032_0678g1448 [Ancylostoma ceylanicum]